jgi:hypothetical protein
MNETQFQIAKKDMKKLTEARFLHFVGEMRRKDNEWILEEFHEFGDEVNNTYYLLYKAGRVEKLQYQRIVSIARDAWAELKIIVEEVEEICRQNPKVS